MDGGRGKNVYLVNWRYSTLYYIKQLQGLKAWRYQCCCPNECPVNDNPPPKCMSWSFISWSSSSSKSGPPCMEVTVIPILKSTFRPSFSCKIKGIFSTNYNTMLCKYKSFDRAFNKGSQEAICTILMIRISHFIGTYILGNPRPVSLFLPKVSKARPTVGFRRWCT